VLKWIRGKRFDLKTTIILLLIALALWALVSWARIRDFIPAELRQGHDSTVQIH
jgi:hypothetical protein